MFWDDQTTGTKLRGRVDRLSALPDGTPLILDLKTTGMSAEPGAWIRHAAGLGYHMQAAHYLDGHKRITGMDAVFLFVVVETNAPHLVSVVEMDEDAIDAGAARVRDAIAVHDQCTRTGEWFGYTETAAATGTLPRWAVYEANHNDQEDW